MQAELTIASLPVLGTCNFCLAYCPIKSMLHNNNNTETYLDMMIKCFNFDIATNSISELKLTICDQCIGKLNDAVQFRDMAISCVTNILSLANIADVKDEIIENNDNLDYEDNFDDNKSDLTPPPEIEIPIIIEPPQIVTRQRKKLKKTIKSDEYDNILKSGIIPFRVRTNIYLCAVCKEKSQDLDVLKKHISTHTKVSLHRALKKMLKSGKKFAKVNDSVTCRTCRAVIQNFCDLKSHANCGNDVRSTWNVLPFKLEKDQTVCPICSRSFLNYVTLNCHMNEHFPNYICENCGKAFASKGRLKGHIRTHEIGEFPCKYCNLVFDKITKRENHISKEHKAGIRYACRKCGLTLPSFYAKQKHLAEIHNEELKRYKCKSCDQSYITPGHLSSHVRRDHLNERNHKCIKCDQAFYSKNTLKMHMVKHDGERIHVCNVCQKSYQRKKTLREHMRIHENDKRFVCPVCGRAFTQKCTLKGHMKVHDRKYEYDHVE